MYHQQAVPQFPCGFRHFDDRLVPDDSITGYDTILTGISGSRLRFNQGQSPSRKAHVDGANVWMDNRLCKNQYSAMSAHPLNSTPNGSSLQTGPSLSNYASVPEIDPIEAIINAPLSPDPIATTRNSLSQAFQASQTLKAPTLAPSHAPTSVPTSAPTSPSPPSALSAAQRSELRLAKRRAQKAAAGRAAKLQKAGPIAASAQLPTDPDLVTAATVPDLFASDDLLLQLPELASPFLTTATDPLTPKAGSASGPETSILDMGIPGTGRRGSSAEEQEARKLRRLLRNRVSAQQARERRKQQVQQLQEDNVNKDDTISQLKSQLNQLQAQNQVLRRIISSMRPELASQLPVDADDVDKGMGNGAGSPAQLAGSPAQLARSLVADGVVPSGGLDHSFSGSLLDVSGGVVPELSL